MYIKHCLSVLFTIYHGILFTYICTHFPLGSSFTQSSIYGHILYPTMSTLNILEAEDAGTVTTNEWNNTYIEVGDPEYRIAKYRNK